MTERDILVPTAVLSLLRREESVRGIADRFGVTEAQVLEWQDVFVVAGTLALKELRLDRRCMPESSRQLKRVNGYSTQPPHAQHHENE